jgi:amino-acid N-acetyltransferase
VRVEIVEREPEHDAAIRALLEEAELPSADLSPDLLARFLVARDLDGVVIGTVGLEVFGSAGLLRSLVVRSTRRGGGLGGLLVDHLERAARGAGVADLYLLTTTAAPFFAARGYRTLDRGRVPPAVAASGEFRLLCPASAVCQHKRLGPGRPEL